MSLYLEILLLFPTSLKVTFSLNKKWQYDSHCCFREYEEEMLSVLKNFQGTKISSDKQKRQKKKRVKIENVCLTFTKGIPEPFITLRNVENIPLENQLIVTIYDVCSCPTRISHTLYLNRARLHSWYKSTGFCRSWWR